MKKKILVILINLVVFIAITGCVNNNSNDDLNKKIIQELEYLDVNITSILMELNNINFNKYTISTEEIEMKKNNENESKENKSDKEESNSQSNEKSQETNISVTEMEIQPVLQLNNNEINWLKIKNEIETINEAWSIILLDLTNVNIKNDDILGFSKAINDAILSIKNENKTDTLKNVSIIYSFIPKFENQIIQGNGNKSIKQVKSYLINAYSIVEDGNWQEIEDNTTNAEELFKNIINDFDYIKNKEFKINKTYILIKELQNALIYRDEQIFYVKFKNVINSIDEL